MKKYYIAFDTRDMPGAIVAVTVSLGKEVVRNMSKPMSINLVDHPFYRQLHEYCRNNPPRKRAS